MYDKGNMTLIEKKNVTFSHFHYQESMKPEFCYVTNV